MTPDLSASVSIQAQPIDEGLIVSLAGEVRKAHSYVREYQEMQNRYETERGLEIQQHPSLYFNHICGGCK